MLKRFKSGYRVVDIITPNTPWMIFGIIPARDAMTPAESVVLFTIDSINISNIKYPITITASPIIPLKIIAEMFDFDFSSLLENLKVKYATMAVKALIIKVAGTYMK